MPNYADQIKRVYQCQQQTHVLSDVVGDADSWDIFDSTVTT